MKTCVKCGKLFRAVTGQKFCHDPCYPKSKLSLNHCTECGRSLGGGDWKRIPEKERICSFCEGRHQKERQAARENSCRKIATKCRVCGEYTYQIRNTNMCVSCFKKSENPTIIEIKEVK